MTKRKERCALCGNSCPAVRLGPIATELAPRCPNYYGLREALFGSAEVELTETENASLRWLSGFGLSGGVLDLLRKAREHAATHGNGAQAVASLRGCEVCGGTSDGLDCMVCCFRAAFAESQLGGAVHEDRVAIYTVPCSKCLHMRCDCAPEEEACVLCEQESELEPGHVHTARACAMRPRYRETVRDDSPFNPSQRALQELLEAVAIELRAKVDQRFILVVAESDEGIQLAGAGEFSRGLIEVLRDFADELEARFNGAQ